MLISTFTTTAESNLRISWS